MAKASRYADLKELREKLLGYSRGAVSRLGAIAQERLEQIEDKGAAPTVLEAEILARLYGVAPERLCDVPITLEKGDSIEILAILDEFHEVPDATKARIVAAANAARDMIELRVASGEELPAKTFTKNEGKPTTSHRGQPPWAEGRDYAQELRARLHLGRAPIRSVRDLVTESFESVSVLYAHLGRSSVAAMAFADNSRGPTIVLNLDGKNSNPCVRRFSLAHELCHVLVDWNRRTPLASLSGFHTDAQLRTEQRANGFAARLLCPETAVQEIAHAEPAMRAARLLIEHYGLHYDAARLYLKNVAGVDLPQRIPVELIACVNLWSEAERPQGIIDFPIEDSPPERRTIVARYAADLYADGRLPRDRFAELVGLTPAHDVEMILDHFGLDHPVMA